MMSFACRRWWCLGLVWLLVVATPVGVMRVPAQSPAAGGSVGREAGTSAKPAASPEALEIAVLRRVDDVGRPPTAEEVEEFLKPKFPPKYSTVLARQALAFRAGAALLRRSGVGFNPYLLLGGEWYPRLRAQLEREASFRAVQRLGERVQGVWMGDTVVVPERVRATGDVVIIARQMVVEGQEVVFKGPHHIYLFQAEPPRFTGAREGRVTIDVSGFGREEWLEAVREGWCQNPTECNGAPGATGEHGRRGDDGGFTDKGADGAHGTCDSANTIDGGHGNDGGPGKPGGHGDDGKNGVPGDGGGVCICDIPAGDTATYQFFARGGNGGEGGRGGDGGNGGKGGNGGNGGNGAGCHCQYGRAGNGGNAGNAGPGGDGGHGGRGGKGGRGGNGGHVAVTYCYPAPRLKAHVSGGLGGVGGLGGSAGNPGPRGDFGAPGNGGDGGWNCRGKNGGKVTLPPRSGYPGSPGQVGDSGGNGSDGTFFHSPRPGCSGSGGGGSPPPIYHCFSFCYYVSFDGGQSWQLISCEYAGCWWWVIVE
jgi:hypothetical protein